MPPLTHAAVGSFVLDFAGGDEETRTPDPLLAKEVLSQLSYIPVWRTNWECNTGAMPALPTMVGHCGFEPQTSPLSGARSNQAELVARRIRCKASLLFIVPPLAWPARRQFSGRQIAFLTGGI